MSRSLALALFAGASAAAPLAQPWADHADALGVVPAGAFQVEASADNTVDQPRQTDAGVLLRWGFAPRWELRAGVPTYSRTFSSSGLGDPTVGAKIEAGALAGWSAAAIGEVSLPLGGAFSRSTPEFALAAMAGRDLAAQFAVEVVGELAYRLRDGAAVGGAAIVLSRPVVGPVEASVEIAAAIEALEVAVVVVESGVAVLLTERLQFRGYAALGIGGRGVPDAVVGIGASVRF